MKIYNIRGFCLGLYILLLATIHLILFSHEDTDLKGLLIFLFYVIGSIAIIKSFLYKPKKEPTTAQDDRNELVDIKSKALSFNIIKEFSIIATVTFMSFAEYIHSDILTGVILTLLILNLFCIAVESLTRFYFNKRV